jgi:hypothetical protein
VQDNIKEQASIVHGFGDSRSERVPWLKWTDFLSHLARLKDKEIKSLYALLLKKALNANAKNAKDPDLVQILVITKAILRDIYQLCSDTSPNWKMT